MENLALDERKAVLREAAKAEKEFGVFSCEHMEVFGWPPVRSSLAGRQIVLGSRRVIPVLITLKTNAASMPRTLIV